MLAEFTDIKTRSMPSLVTNTSRGVTLKVYYNMRGLARDLSWDAADTKTGADDFIFGNAAAWFGDCELSVANYVFRDWRIRVLTKIQALSHAAAAAPSLLITEHQPVTPHGMFSTHPRSQRHLGGRRLGQTTWAGPGALIQELSSRNALWAMWSTPLAGPPWPREQPRKSSIF